MKHILSETRFLPERQGKIYERTSTIKFNLPKYLKNYLIVLCFIVNLLDNKT